MPDLPEHLLIPVNAAGEGPVDHDKADDWVCWCGDDGCLLWLPENPPNQPGGVA